MVVTIRHSTAVVTATSGQCWSGTAIKMRCRQLQGAWCPMNAEALLFLDPQECNRRTRGAFDMFGAARSSSFNYLRCQDILTL